MKKYAIILAGCLLVSTPEFVHATNKSATLEVGSVLKKQTESLGGGRRNKNGTYRKRKGFLWGLFKGKSSCDCPKH